MQTGRRLDAGAVEGALFDRSWGSAPAGSLARAVAGGYNGDTTGTSECPCPLFTCTSIPNTRFWTA